MPATEPNDFFSERRSFTEIRQELFDKYFDDWCRIRLHALKEKNYEAIAFIDLHASNGQALEESPEFSVDHYIPLYKSIVKRPLLNKIMRTYFHDKSKDVLEHLCDGKKTLPYYEELTHSPVPLTNTEERALLAETLMVDCPSLIFIDPFQSAFAQQMLLETVNTWHSDLFMLISPENITKAVSAGKAGKPLTELLGDRLQKISNYCRKEKDKERRQPFILDNFISSLQEKGHFTLLFNISLPEQEQPEDYLLFSSPDFLAYSTFKQIILPYSTFQEEDIPEFFANKLQRSQLSLFEQKPEFTLQNLLVRVTDKAGIYKYKSIDKIYEMDSGCTNYIRENYITAFEQLRKAGKIELLNPITMQSIRQPTLTSIVKYKL